jgi:Family of unknown function (DUF6114)
VTSTDAHRKSSAVARGWRNFRRWRRGRPFWGGLFTLLAGLEIFGSTQLTLGEIPLVLGLCGLLIWLTPQQRVFYGVIAAVVAVYSLIGVNLGGFFLGMLFGVIGGSLAAAWTPVKPAPPAEEADEPGGGPADAEAGEADEYAQPEARVDELLTGPLTDVLPPPVNPLTQPAQPATPAPGAHRYDDVAGAAPRDMDDTQHIPVQRDDEEQWSEEPSPEESPPPDKGNGTGPLPRRTPRLFVITFVPLLLTAVAIAGLRGGAPARAEPASPYPSPCPTGTKSASAAKAKAKSPSSSASKSPASEPAEVTKTPTKTASPAASASPSASPSPTSTQDGGLIGGVLDGIGGLLGIGEDASPSASATPSATPTSTREPSSGTDQTPKPETTLSSAEPTKSASATPEPTSSADCVVVDPKEHAATGVPAVQKVPDQMLGTKLTLEGFAFDGVTELNTADGGTIRVLQFSMTKAVTDNFELRVPGPGDRTISLKSTALTVQQADNGGQRVAFYCSKFTGTLNVLGVDIAKLTFTPDLPPPLTLPSMVFTGIDIQLVFVDTDVLKAPNLHTTIQS